jgi:hypothetical protein
MIILRHRANRRCARINQGAKQPRENGLAGALLAIDRQHRIRAAVPQRRHQPCHREQKIIVAADVQKLAQILDHAAAFRVR